MLHTEVVKRTWILFWLVMPCVAQPTPKFSAAVELRVASSDEPLRNEINSLLKRELRGLGDVTLVVANSDLVISVVAEPITSKPGKVLGFSIATLIMRMDQGILLNPSFGLKQKLLEAQLNWLTSWFSSSPHILKFRLRSGSMDDVQEVCRDVIADFDDTLELDRHAWHNSHNNPAPDKP